MKPLITTISLILVISVGILPHLSQGFQRIPTGTRRPIHQRQHEEHPTTTRIINTKSSRHRIIEFSSGLPLRLRTEDETSSEIDTSVKDPEDMTEEEYKATLSPEELKEYEEQEKDFYLIQRIEAEVLAESGVALEELINPSKVINLERDIAKLTLELEDTSISEEQRGEINQKLEKKQKTLLIEKRAVMKGWLKSLFVAQSIIAGIASLVMVYDGIPGQLSLDLPLPVKVLGFWMWWLFIVPSLRARKPSAEEKDALNYAFLGTPLISVAMPSLTRDTAVIWWANFAVVAGCYIYAYYIKSPAEREEIVDEDGNVILGKPLEQPNFIPQFMIQAFKALDYGSGQERGARK